MSTSSKQELWVGIECRRAGMCRTVDTEKPARPRMATPNPNGFKRFDIQSGGRSLA
jgi:hypothetical protein